MIQDFLHGKGFFIPVRLVFSLVVVIIVNYHWFLRSICRCPAAAFASGTSRRRINLHDIYTTQSQRVPITQTVRVRESGGWYRRRRGLLRRGAWWSF
jgi:hypothetical protein